MKKIYEQKEYQQDLNFIKFCTLREDDNSMGKLEVLLTGPGVKILYVGHASLPQFLSMQTVYNMLENPAQLAREISRSHKDEPLPGNEFKQVFDEFFDIIHKRVAEEFGKRYRGALQRVKRYEQGLVGPHLKELRSALRAKDPERVYDLAERIGIMTENFSDEHPLVREYDVLQPRVEEILNPWKPVHN